MEHETPAEQNEPQVLTDQESSSKGELTETSSLGIGPSTSLQINLARKAARWLADLELAENEVDQLVAAVQTYVVYAWTSLRQLSQDMLDEHLERWTLRCYRARTQYQFGLLPLPQGTMDWLSLIDGLELGERYRLELNLIYDFGCSAKEVAIILDLPAQAVEEDLRDLRDILSTAALANIPDE
jgi:hypothetical protein